MGPLPPFPDLMALMAFAAFGALCAIAIALWSVYHLTMAFATYLGG